MTTKATKQTKADLQEQLESAVFHLAYSIYFNTDRLTTHVRHSRLHSHSEAERWPLERTQSLNRGLLNSMHPALRAAVISKLRNLFRSDREMAAKRRHAQSQTSGIVCEHGTAALTAEAQSIAA